MPPLNLIAPESHPPLSRFRHLTVGEPNARGADAPGPGPGWELARAFVFEKAAAVAAAA